MCAAQERESQEPDWDLCPKGALSKIPDTIDDLERRRFLTFVGTGSLSLVMASLLGGTLFSRFAGAESPYGCKETRALVAKFVQAQLTETQFGLVIAHLEVCGQCFQYYRAHGAKFQPNFKPPIGKGNCNSNGSTTKTSN